MRVRNPPQEPEFLQYVKAYFWNLIATAVVGIMTGGDDDQKTVGFTTRTAAVSRQSLHSFCLAPVLLSTRSHHAKLENRQWL